MKKEPEIPLGSVCDHVDRCVFLLVKFLFVGKFILV